MKLRALIAIMAMAMGSLFVASPAALAATQNAVIDFEGLAEGMVVDSVSAGSGISGDPIAGSVAVFGDSADPSITTNAAIIFDATCDGGCSGGDDDLFKPGLGNVLIMAEDLVDANNDGLIDDPDDADLRNAPFSFDFSSYGPGTVTVESLDVMDIEARAEEPAFLELFDSSNASLGTVPIPATGDNGLATVPVGVSGVARIVVTLQGSGAIDNIRISVEEEEPPGAEGCTPGFWKNHLSAWGATGHNPGDDFDATFGVDLFDPNITLQQALNLGGAGVKALARHAVAALLNASHPDVDYPLSSAQIIAAVQAAASSGDFETTKNQFEAGNELGCPING